MGPTPPGGTWRRVASAWRRRRRAVAALAAERDALLAERRELEATIDQLRRERDFHDQVLRSGPLILLRPPGSVDGRVLYASDHAERLLGSALDGPSREGVLRSRVHPDDLVHVLTAVAELEAGAPRAHFDVRIRDTAGHYRWASVLAVTGCDEDGNPGALLAYAFDVDERRRAEEAGRERERELAAVFASSPDAIFIIGDDGRVQTMSPAVELVLGHPPEWYQGRPAIDLVHPDDRACVLEQMGVLRRGEAPSVVMRYRSRHADGHDVVFESRCTLLAEGGRGSAVFVARDVTEQARVEQAQHEARLAAEAANRSKSEFLSRMSHELRTPLNAVLGFAQLLELEDLTDEQRDSTEQILHGGRHLLALIDEVLDISRIETGQLSLWLEPLRLRDVVDDAVELVRPLALPATVELVTESASCACWVLADRHRLTQVLLNLLSNAVKYNREGGSVTVSCEHGQVDGQGERVLLRVADTGRGIRPEHVDLLFTPFERLEATQTTIEGSGIGLALSRRLAEAMGGTIGVESRYGEGSTFTVALCPADPPE